MAKNQTDIIIQLGGSRPQTIEARAKSLSKLAKSMTQMNKAYAAAPKAAIADFRKATNAQKTFTNSVEKSTKATKKQRSALTQTGNALDNFGTLFRRMIRIMSAYWIITTVTTAFRNFTRTLVEAPAQMELWSKQLRTLTGSATVAAQRLELLKDVAIETPLELPDLFEGLTALQAFRTEISERTLPLIADLAAVSGRKFREVAEVVGKVIAGSPQAITRSLPTLGINPIEFRQLADEMGSRAEALWAIITDRFQGFAKESADTTLGVLSNIKDAFFVVMADIGGGGLAPFRDLLYDIFNALQRLRNDPARLNDLANKFRLVATAITGTLRSMGEMTMKTKELAEAVGGLKVILAVLAALMTGALLTALATVTAAIAKFLAVVAVGTLSNPLAWIAGAVTFLTVKFFQHRAEIKEVELAYKTLGSQISETMRLAARGAEFVDARAADRQIMSLLDLGNRGVMLQSGLSTEFDPGDWISQDQARRAGLTSFLTDTVNTLRSVGTEESLGLATMFESFLSSGTHMWRDWQDEIDSALGYMGKLSDKLYEIRDQARKTKAPDFSIGAVGSDDGETPLDKLVRDFDIIKAQFSRGSITQSEAIAGARGIIETISPEIDRLLSSVFPEEQEYGVKAQSFIDGIAKWIDDLLGVVENKTSGGKTVEEMLVESLGLDFDSILTNYSRGALTATEAQFQAVMLQERIAQLIPDMMAGDAAQRELGNKLQGLLEQIQKWESDLLSSLASPSGAGQGDLIGARLSGLGIALDLGAIDLQTYNEEVLTFIERLKEYVRSLMSSGDPMKVVMAISLIPKIEEAEGALSFESKVNTALETAIRNSIQKAADTLAEALGALFTGGDVINELAKGFAAIMNMFGDFLIQMGTAALVLDRLKLAIQGAGPAGALAAIAGGIALKAAASALLSSVNSNPSQGTSSTASGAPTSWDYPTFYQPSQGQGATVNFNISTMDAKGVKEFMEENIQTIGQTIATVARQDRQTRGAAFGAFVPQGA